MNITIVAGSFDDSGGKPSGFANKLFTALFKHANFLASYNGGTWDKLNEIYDSLPSNGVVIWIADVPNDKPKLISKLKHDRPNIILVTSKRNLDNTYSTMELVSRALEIKSNLLLEFTGTKENVLTTILDPLANAFVFKESNIDVVAKVLYNRLTELVYFKRTGSTCLGDAISVPDDPEIISFIEKVKVQANKFHEIIHGVNTTRMLGNASFRCQRGFPSFRVQFENTDRIFVSRRNVDKRFISKDEFVAVRDLNGMVGYYGPNKPSVDTPVQLRLYKWFPKVNYMLHSHTYIEGAPFTSKRVPCGAIEEASYICGATPGYEMYPDYNAYNMAINILGHGSIVLAKTPEFIDNIKWVPRPVPEVVL